MRDSILSAPPVLERFRLDGRVAFVTGGGQGIGSLALVADVTPPPAVRSVRLPSRTRRGSLPNGTTHFPKGWPVCGPLRDF
jgi:hypothetical protein